MASRVSTYQLPDGRTARTTDGTLCWRVVQDGDTIIMATETTGRTRTRHTMIADDDPATVASALDAPSWEADRTLPEGTLVQHDGVVFRVDQEHTTQAGWTPGATPALYTTIGAVGSSGPQPWRQPEGAHDAYDAGDRVTHLDREDTMGTGADTIWIWESKIDANTTEPGQDGDFHRYWDPVEEA